MQIASSAGGVTVIFTLYGDVPEARRDREQQEAQRRASQLSYVRPKPTEKQCRDKYEQYWRNER